MKIKKIRHLNNKIIKIQALRLYSKKNSTNANFSSIQTYLNKISNIIYKYHKKNKKILFLGFPISFKNILKNTKHKLIPEFISFNGILTNRTSLNKITKTKKYSLSTLKLFLKIKKLDLIIIYTQNHRSTIIEESYITRIPTIIFNENLHFNNKITYESLGNYKFFNEKTKNNNFIISFIKTILLRAKKIKKFKKFKN